MDPENKPQPEDKSAVVVEAAAAHAEAVEAARKAQLEEQMLAQRSETTQIFVNAMRRVLTEGDEGTKALLIQKIPLLCTDILKIKLDLVWIKWLLMGLIGGVGLLTIALLSSKGAL